MNTVTLNMHICMSYTGLIRRNTIFYSSQEYVNSYSTCRVLTEGRTTRPYLMICVTTRLTVSTGMCSHKKYTPPLPLLLN